jgi:hypothetical protein
MKNAIVISVHTFGTRGYEYLKKNMHEEIVLLKKEGYVIYDWNL